VSRDPKEQPIPPFNYTQGLYAMAQVIADAIGAAITLNSSKYQLPANLIQPLIEHIKRKHTCHTNWTIKHGVIVEITSSIRSGKDSEPLTLHSSYQTPFDINLANPIKAMLLDSAISSLQDGSFKDATATNENIKKLYAILKTHRDEILQSPHINRQLSITTQITKHTFSEGGFAQLLKDSNRTGSCNSLSINGVNARTAWNILHFLEGIPSEKKWNLFCTFCERGFDPFCDDLKTAYEALEPQEQSSFLDGSKTAIQASIPENCPDLSPKALSIDNMIQEAQISHHINGKNDFRLLMPPQDHTPEASNLKQIIKRDIALFVRNNPLTKIVKKIQKNLDALSNFPNRYTQETHDLKKPLTNLKNDITSAMEADSLPKTAEVYQNELNTIMGNESISNKQKPLKPKKQAQQPILKASKHRPLYIYFAIISSATGATATPCMAIFLPPLFQSSMASTIYAGAATLAVMAIAVTVLFSVLAGKKSCKGVKRITEQPSKQGFSHGRRKGEDGP